MARSTHTCSRPRRINIQAVAREAGVSVATISRAFMSPDRLAPATLAKVRETVKRLGYTPNAQARNLRLATTRLIIALVPDITNPFFSQVIQGIERVAHENGYSVLLGDTQDDRQREQAYAQMVTARQADGLITLAPRLPRLGIEGRLPIVNACEYVTDESISSVRIDNVAAAISAIQYLLALGHRDIAFIGGQPDSPISKDRESGYRTTMQAAGLAHDSHIISQGGFSVETGARSAERLLASRKRPTAIFCASDEMAIGAISVIRANGLKVPDDISVVGFDDIHLARYYDPPLTTVAQPMGEIGEEATKLLLDILSDASTPTVKRILPTDLVIRRSTAAPSR